MTVRKFIAPAALPDAGDYNPQTDQAILLRDNVLQRGNVSVGGGGQVQEGIDDIIRIRKGGNVNVGRGNPINLLPNGRAGFDSDQEEWVWRLPALGWVVQNDGDHYHIMRRGILYLNSWQGLGQAQCGRVRRALYVNFEESPPFGVWAPFRTTCGDDNDSSFPEPFRSGSGFACGVYLGADEDDNHHHRYYIDMSANTTALDTGMTYESGSFDWEDPPNDIFDQLAIDRLADPF